MLELTGLTRLAAPVVKATAASTTAATSPARRPSWRNVAHAAPTRHVPVMAIEVPSMPTVPPRSRRGRAMRQKCTGPGWWTCDTLSAYWPDCDGWPSSGVRPVPTSSARSAMSAGSPWGAQRGAKWAKASTGASSSAAPTASAHSRPRRSRSRHRCTARPGPGAVPRAGAAGGGATPTDPDGASPATTFPTGRDRTPGSTGGAHLDRERGGQQFVPVEEVGADAGHLADDRVVGQRGPELADQRGGGPGGDKGGGAL